MPLNLKLKKHILKVEYTGLPNGKSYFEALKYLRFGFGYYLSFTLNEQPDIARKFFEILKEFPAFKHRLTYDVGKSRAYLTVANVDYEELEANFESSFQELAHVIRSKYLIDNPWLEMIQMD